jgi:F-type H+-transporting ATPase subunit gamma
MPSLIDLRRRIRAVKNTQQITKAMKMVAAAKLRRAQERILRARPYAVQMRRVLASVASRVDPAAHPLLAVREVRPDSRRLVVIVTADKGLCGSFNTNVIKAAGSFIASSEQPCALSLVGRKAHDFFARRGFPVRFEQVGLFAKLRYEDAQTIAQEVMSVFTSAQADEVRIVYNEFKSVMTQHVVIEQLLPIRRGDVPEASGEQSLVDYLYEPAPQEIFDQLLPRYVEIQVYRALLESNAAFFAAEMIAMDTATKNSEEMVAQLTLNMNKVRQAAITREIIEVVSGSWPGRAAAGA